jgi:hypothetical protein
VRHRAEVQLDEADQLLAIGIGDLDADIGRDGPFLAAERGERLACFGLALEARQPGAFGQPRLQHHVQLAETSGVGEEQRVRLTPLAAARRWLAVGDCLALARRPKVMRR